METERAVHVVDDHAGVRRSLETLLRSAGFGCISYESALAFLESMQEPSAGCVLVDVRMPEMDGFELQARLNRIGCGLPIILMTAQGDVELAVRAMKAGAVDFIEKPFDDERLIAAIDAAHSGSGRRAADREVAEAAERIASLSPRERQVLDGLLAGRQSKVIAYDLGISLRTVEAHRARLMERLGTRRLAEAIRLAVLAGLAPDRRDFAQTADAVGRRQCRDVVRE
jgi:two-component system, LuxR family, response regulator FixJ